MSAITDVTSVIRDATKLTDDVKRVGETLKSLSGELRDQDRRLTRRSKRRVGTLRPSTSSGQALPTLRVLLKSP